MAINDVVTPQSEAIRQQNPANLTDKELSDFISFFQNQVRINSTAETPGQLGLVNRWSKQLSDLQAEQIARQTKVKEQEQVNLLTSLFGGSGSGGGGEVVDTGETRRSQLEELFGSQKSSVKQSLDDLFKDQRGQALDEAAVTGNLRQPGFLSSRVAGIDASKQKALADALTQLTGQQSQARLSLEEALANEALTGRGQDIQRASSLGSLLSGESQFGRGFGLQQEQFGEQKRRNTLEDIFQQQALSQAERLGQLQAKAQKPSGFQEFAQVTSGLGGLLGGFGSLTKPKIK